jgi:hypothetical protein
MFKTPTIRVSPSPLMSKDMRELAGLYPILPASKSGQEWWRKLLPTFPDERQITQDKFVTNMLNTFKYCPGVYDFINCGYMVRWVHDIEFYVANDGSVSWMLPPLIPEIVKPHKKEQIGGCPFYSGEGAEDIIKVVTPFLIETPKGWSILFCKPFYEYNSDFDQCWGVLDADQKPTSCHEINVFFRFNSKDKVIKFKAGDPLIQLIPFKRINTRLEYTSEPSKKVKDQQQKDAVTRGSRFPRMNINGKTLQNFRDSTAKHYK